ncbi:MAG: hypothetical protein SGI92_07670 [Bryobacteraceae bacterium]|nr:hypothetical protein [Bryobacteraceae bacterium]
MAVAGTRTRSAEFTLDGIPNMGSDGIIAFQPPPEMVMTQPFFINKNLYDTRTTNPGESFYDKRNRLWPSSVTNRYRAQLRGPVVIPKLYNGGNW